MTVGTTLIFDLNQPAGETFGTLFSVFGVYLRKLDRSYEASDT